MYIYIYILFNKRSIFDRWIRTRVEEDNEEEERGGEREEK